jgi:uncharacterized membrane protein
MFVYWFSQILIWYLAVSLINLIFLPTNTLVFGKLKDKGYPFSKVLGLGLFGYLVFALNFAKVIAFSANQLIFILVLTAVLNLILLKTKKIQLPKLRTVLGYELFFLLMFCSYAYLKGFEPSIHSLEKYMDFGFIQSILNQKFLPPADIWFASTLKESLSINYYYFGHFLTALIINLTRITPSVGYNLMLAFIFALATTISFSLGANLYQLLAGSNKQKNSLWLYLLAGLLSMAIMNFGANLQTIYLFTKNYVADNPVPFWQIWSGYNPQEYWYPNATRFIPFTIHEFPSYSYIVSDLHGHVLDIPFVLYLLGLTIVIGKPSTKIKQILLLSLYSLFLAINYMTNSTDFLVYGVVLFFVLLIKFDNLAKSLFLTIATVSSALFLTLPFSLNFKPFASSLGVNCAPLFLTKISSFGPLVFEPNKCQNSPLWMLFILWGFFWFIYLIFLLAIFFNKHTPRPKKRINYYFFFIFTISVLLTMFSEFLYFKDIYPDHFRANTMFKLGYQAYIMMSILSGVVIIYVSKGIKYLGKGLKVLLLTLLIPMLSLVLVYYQYAVPSYFGKNGFKTLDGSAWIKSQYPDSYQIINKLNDLKNKWPGANIVEAHGDSYTDYNLISAHTGIPTIIGWPVHEWLWRGSYEKVSPRVEEVRLIYEGTNKDLPQIKKLLKKYQIKFIVVAEMEKSKYPVLNYQKFYKIAQPVFSNKKTNSFLFKVND